MAGTGPVHHDTTTLYDRSGRLTTAAADMEASIARAKAEVDALNQEWGGAASAAFQEIYLQFNSSAIAIQTALGSIARTLAGTANAYDETEAALKGNIQRYTV